MAGDSALCTLCHATLLELDEVFPAAARGADIQAWPGILWCLRCGSLHHIGANTVRISMLSEGWRAWITTHTDPYIAQGPCDDRSCFWCNAWPGDRHEPTCLYEQVLQFFLSP